MNELQQVFKHSTDAVFGIDTDGKIRFMNNSCESLLGYSETDIRDKTCAGILCGMDVHGEVICGNDCPVRQMAAGDLPFGDFDMMVKRKNGSTVLVNVGASYTPAKVQQKYSNVDVILSLRHVNSQRLLQRMSNRNKTANGQTSRPATLTNREKEMLTLASEGIKTLHIAQQKCISIETVRNHFKNILLKLGVHSRTEAVSMALRQNLIS
jgi:DNA-binding CsgD family transcriptional regulator